MRSRRIRRSRFAWLPNAITVGRLAALPVLLWVLVSARRHDHRCLAAAIFAVSALTDLLDGCLAARGCAPESAFGRIADPLADRLLVAVGLVGLILLEPHAPRGPAILLARDVSSWPGACRPAAAPASTCGWTWRARSPRR